jgi:hypothetical protein
LGVDVTHLDQYDSDTERGWAMYGAALLADELGVQIVRTEYHLWTFHIPGGKYTPDFQHFTTDGQVIVVEVKGSKAQKGYRDARTHLRAAARINPWFIFYEALGNQKQGITLERI